MQKMPKPFTKSCSTKTKSSNEGVFTIQNPQGLHARAAAAFVKIATQFEAEIVVKKEKMAVNGKSILGVLMLGAESGEKIQIEAVGKQAPEAVAALGQLIGNHFEP